MFLSIYSPFLILILWKFPILFNWELPWSSSLCLRYFSSQLLLQWIQLQPLCSNILNDFHNFYFSFSSWTIVNFIFALIMSWFWTRLRQKLNIWDIIGSSLEGQHSRFLSLIHFLVCLKYQFISQTAKCSFIPITQVCYGRFWI